MRLMDQVVIVTGGAGGIGKVVARLICSEGGKAVIIDHSSDAIQSAIQYVKSNISKACIMGVQCDIRSPSECKDAVAAVMDEYHSINALINNAAVRNYEKSDSLSPSDWHSVLDVNLVGASNITVACLPALKVATSPAIVNISSCYAVMGRPGMAVYDATKAAQIAYTRTLAHELAPFGIRANSVCPGSTLTEFHISRGRAAGKSIEEIKSERKETSLIGRWADPEEIAWPAIWMISSEASFITGTNLMVDGGLHIL